MKDETLCWGCQNYAKCSWARGEPVKGWEAEPTKYVDEYNGDVITQHSYLIKKCPEYIPDKLEGDNENCNC